MAPLGYAAKFDPFLSLKLRPHALHPVTIQGKEGIKFCHLATLYRDHLERNGKEEAEVGLPGLGQYSADQGRTDNQFVSRINPKFFGEFQRFGR